MLDFFAQPCKLKHMRTALEPVFNTRIAPRPTIFSHCYVNFPHKSCCRALLQLRQHSVIHIVWLRKIASHYEKIASSRGQLSLLNTGSCILSLKCKAAVNKLLFFVDEGGCDVTYCTPNANIQYHNIPHLSRYIVAKYKQWNLCRVYRGFEKTTVCARMI